MDHPLQHWESRIGRRLKLRDLHVLFAVVQWGSMAKAARELAMSQPAVSKVIAELEDVLRVRLLDRSSRGIEPTLYAHALLKRSSVAFDELRQGVRDIEFLADPTAGEIRIAAPETVISGLLSAGIERLSRSHPQIVVHVASESSMSLEFRELRERKVDLMLARLPVAFTADDIDIEALFDDPSLVVAGAGSRWAARRKVSLFELANEPWIISPTAATGAMIAEAFKMHGLETPQARVSTTSVLLRNHLLATGRYLAVLPGTVLRHSAKQWSLKALPVDLGVKPRAVAIVTLKHRTLSPVVELFIEHIRAVVRRMVVLSGSK